MARSSSSAQFDLFSAPAPLSEAEEQAARMRAEVRVKQDLARGLASAGRPVSFAHSNGLVGLAGPDPSKPDGFRFTRSDASGPVGHHDLRSLYEAILAGLQGGFMVQHELLMLQAPAPAPVDLSKEPAVPSDFCAEQRAIIAARRIESARLAEPGLAVAFTHTNERKTLAGPDVSKPGGFRLTYFDANGPSGHMEYPDLEKAIRQALIEGYAPQASAPAPEHDILPNQADEKNPAARAMHQAEAMALPGKPIAFEKEGWFEALAALDPQDPGRYMLALFEDYQFKSTRTKGFDSLADAIQAALYSGYTPKALQVQTPLPASDPKSVTYGSLPEDMQVLIFQFVEEDVAEEDDMDEEIFKPRTRLPLTRIATHRLPQNTLNEDDRGTLHALSMDVGKTPPVLIAHGYFLDGRHRRFAAGYYGVESLLAIDLSKWIKPYPADEDVFCLGKIAPDESPMEIATASPSEGKTSPELVSACILGNDLEGDAGNQRDIALAMVAGRFLLTHDEVRELVEVPEVVLRERDRIEVPSNGETPQPASSLPLGLAKIAYFNTDVREAYVEVLRAYAPSDLTPTEHEEGVRGHPTFARYVAWWQQGHVAPPVTVAAHPSTGRLFSTNRRRVLTAQTAGVPSMPGWFSPNNEETGNPLKYGDVLRAFQEAMAPDPEPSSGMRVSDPFPMEVQSPPAVDYLLCDRSTYEKALYKAALARLDEGRDVMMATSTHVTPIKPHNREVLRLDDAGHIRLSSGRRGGKQQWMELGPISQSIDTLAEGLGMPTSYQRSSAAALAVSPEDAQNQRLARIQALRPFAHDLDAARSAWAACPSVDLEEAVNTSYKALYRVGADLGLSPIAVDAVLLDIEPLDTPQMPENPDLSSKASLPVPSSQPQPAKPSQARTKAVSRMSM